MFILTLLTICVSFTTLTATPWNISLTAQQRRTIFQNRDKILDIKENYWNNRRYYSKLEPILEVTKQQKILVLKQFGFFFSELPPQVPTGFVFNGTEFRDGVGMETVSGVPVCPPVSSYEDIHFVVNDQDEVLQMIEIDSLGQWVLDESCQSPIGTLVNSICIERQRLVDAIVFNVETEVIDSQQIKVVSCSAEDVSSVP